MAPGTVSVQPSPGRRPLRDRPRRRRRSWAKETACSPRKPRSGRRPDPRSDDIAKRQHCAATRRGTANDRGRRSSGCRRLATKVAARSHAYFGATRFLPVRTQAIDGPECYRTRQTTVSPRMKGPDRYWQAVRSAKRGGNGSIRRRPASRKRPMAPIRSRRRRRSSASPEAADARCPSGRTIEGSETSGEALGKGFSHRRPYAGATDPTRDLPSPSAAQTVRRRTLHGRPPGNVGTVRPLSLEL